MDKSWKIQEKLWFFALLIFAGGFYGGYTYSLRGQVFANAQTANLVMMMLSIGKGNWGRALYSLAPFSAYLFGVGLSEYLRQKKSLEAKSTESNSVTRKIVSTGSTESKRVKTVPVAIRKKEV